MKNWYAQVCAYFLLLAVALNGAAYAQNKSASKAGKAPTPYAGASQGSLAEAASPKEQCQVVADWYAPVTSVSSFDRMSSGKILRAIAPLFLDEVFEPVFGSTFVSLKGKERSAIGAFIRRTCYDTFGFERHRNVFADVFGSPVYVRDITAIQKRSSDTEQWAVATREELSQIRAIGPDAQNRLRKVEADISRSRLEPDVVQQLRDEAAAVRIALETTAQDQKAAKLLADLNSVGNDLGSGNLGTALRVADQARTSKLTPTQEEEIVTAAQQKAIAIIEPYLANLSRTVSQQPGNLERLRQARAGLRPLHSYQNSLEKTFRSLDFRNSYGPIYSRIRELESDPAVLSELRTALADAVKSEHPREAVEAIAVDVSSPSGLTGEIQKLVSEARSEAEVAAIVVEDRSVRQDAGEPTAREIAALALQRVRKATAGIAERDTKCTSQRITDPIEGIFCLMRSPALITGQKGSAATLLRVTKLGCITEKEQVQFLCTFQQEFRLDIAGGEAFGAARWGDLTQALSSQEAVEARFIRAAGGGWTVIGGDLR